METILKSNTIYNYKDMTFFDRRETFDYFAFTTLKNQLSIVKYYLN